MELKNQGNKFRLYSEMMATDVADTLYHVIQKNPNDMDVAYGCMNMYTSRMRETGERLHGMMGWLVGRGCKYTLVPTLETSDDREISLFELHIEVEPRYATMFRLKWA